MDDNNYTPDDKPPSYNDIGGVPPANYPPSGTHPPPQQGYPPSYPGGHPPQQADYPPSVGGYPPQQGGYPPQQGGYPPQDAYQQQPPAGTYPPPPGAYPPPPGGYPPGQPGYPAQYPPQGSIGPHASYPSQPQQIIVLQAHGSPAAYESEQRTVGIMSGLTCLFCCCPLGTVALYHLHQSNEAMKSGQQGTAQLYLSKAKRLALIGAIMGAFFYVYLAVKNIFLG